MEKLPQASKRSSWIEFHCSFFRIKRVVGRCCPTTLFLFQILAAPVENLPFMNIELIKSHFPVFSHHPDLVYLDNAATTHKPNTVIKGIQQFYERDYATVHRGMYSLAIEASRQYEAVRQKVAQYINASTSKNIIFNQGATNGINFVAQAFLEHRLQADDIVMISGMEHHANLIPWQQLCKNTGAKLRVIPILKNGTLDQNYFERNLSEKVKMIALSHISNVLGTINPIKRMIAQAHKYSIPVLIDASQSIAHYPIDVQDLGVDFLVFSAHKMYAPTGVGILYVQENHLQNLKITTFGGGIVRQVNFEETTFADAPQCFEAGTPSIASVIGLGHAIDFLKEWKSDELNHHFTKLTRLAMEGLQQLENVRILGNTSERAPIVSFVLESVHPHDLTTFLAAESVAVRAGHHCAQPLLHAMHEQSATRISFGIYNQVSDVKRFLEAVERTIQFFKA